MGVRRATRVATPRHAIVHVTLRRARPRPLLALRALHPSVASVDVSDYLAFVFNDRLRSHCHKDLQRVDTTPLRLSYSHSWPLSGRQTEVAE